MTYAVSVAIVAVIAWLWYGARSMRRLNADKRATLPRFQDQPVQLAVEVARVWEWKAGQIRDVTEKGVVFDDGKRERFYPFGAIISLRTPSGSTLADWARPKRGD